MITTIKEYNLYLESNKIQGSDVFIIDVIKSDINEEYLEDLEKYLLNYPRVFNVYTDKTDLTFNNEVKKIKKEPNKPLKIEDVKNLFPIHTREYVYDQLRNIPDDNTKFETVYSDYYIYLGQHKWLYIEKEISDILNKIKKLERSIILIGNYKSLQYFYLIIQKFNIPVEINTDFTYSSKLPKLENIKESLNHNIKFENIHINYINDQHDYQLKAFVDNKTVAQIDYSQYSGKIYIKMIESYVKVNNYGFQSMLKLAEMYGYENIERTQLTPDGLKLRQKLDKHFNFNYTEYKKSQNKHLSIDTLNKIRTKYPLTCRLLSDICLFGYSSGWQKNKHLIDSIIKECPIDINDACDITNWIKNSETNTNSIADNVPDYILNDLKKIT